MSETRKGEKPRLTSEELENSAPVDWGRRLTGPAGAMLRHVVFELLAASEHRQRRRQPAAQASWEMTVEALTANLLALALSKGGGERFLAVPFDRNAYTDEEVSLAAATSFRDLGETAGWLEVANGFRKEDDWTEPFGRRTRLRAAGSLLALFESTEVSPRSVSRASASLLRLRGVRPQSAPPDDVEATRPFLEALNARLSAVLIELPQTFWDAQHLWHEPDEGSRAEEKALHRQYARDTSAVALYRVFTKSWDRGGRLYGGWWMSLPKRLRPNLTIDGKATVERDYGQLHPTLLYARTGIPVPADVYGLSFCKGTHVREVAKRTFARLVNSDKPVKRAHKDDKGKLPGRTRFRDFLYDFRHKLEPISRWFGVEEGMRLQYEDSQLALAVLGRLHSAGIAALPIHDSFIVAEEHDLDLQEAMHISFVERYGHAPVIR